MLKETEDNFMSESYGNDGNNEKWEDRFGYNRKLGLVNAEPYLRYRKLQRTGRLMQSIKPITGRVYAGLTSDIPYAIEHNEGVGGGGGNVFVKPPYSSEVFKLGSKPKKRQFAGIGKRTIKNALEIYENEIKQIL